MIPQETATMAGCELSQDQIDKAVDFHGHWCPGLAIGLRAGEYVLNHMGRSEDEEVVALVETDMCAVDGIQSLTGCTFGKGNLRYQDHGKLAFTFFRRSDGSGVRLVFDATRLGSPDSEFTKLNQQWLRGDITPGDKDRLMEMRAQRSKDIMESPLEELFAIKEPNVPLPRPARILTSLVCDQCGESVMESRTRRLDDRTLCIPCFEGQGQSKHHACPAPRLFPRGKEHPCQTRPAADRPISTTASSTSSAAARVVPKPPPCRPWRRSSAWTGSWPRPARRGCSMTTSAPRRWPSTPGRASGTIRAATSPPCRPRRWSFSA
eukprot:TRINITY_DN5548_c0_g3_i1.p1 TRINITY_DN5548_c0_g3~~TRINITY_DN5548_c0_g3_i1.p1  ORF type:complete len:321 (-),score=63.20 TRINITY_DN5548_c0_g3_i1:143-1105(-)